MAISYSVSDIGRRRQMNQDFVFSSDRPVGRFPNLYIVADGMGGHQAGEYASQFTVDRIASIMQDSDNPSPEEVMVLALQEANRELRLIAQSDPKYYGMGTTAVMAVITGNILQAANVGDSRLYIVDRTRGMYQVTTDHSLVEEMIQAGSLDKEAARIHPDKNVITRAVGAEATLKVDLFTEVLTGQSLILMCTDGLTNMLDDRQIEQIIWRSRTIEEAASVLVTVANEAGGMDNISVTLIDPFRSGNGDKA